MKELTIEEKAKHYDEALEQAKKELNTCGSIDCDAARQIFRFFPELKDSEDERIRKNIVDFLSRQGASIKYDFAGWIAWLEKQGKQEELYIRFGEIPTDEKSKIYNGEIEVGTENGVSVYHAFKTHEGDIVLGLSLPITKTTLYTQQHLIEYSDRPCYLVKGDYVGKDTDGQPLINNVSIIKKIGTYRVKEEKQDEQKETLCDKCKREQPSHSCQDIIELGRCAVKHVQKPADKIEPKFKKGDWVVCDYLNNHTGNQVTEVKQIDNETFGYTLDNGTYFSGSFEKEYHLWTIQDAKDGDVIEFGDHGRLVVGIASYVNKTTGKVDVNCLLENNNFKVGTYYNLDTINPHPATKERRDILFAKMKEAGYKWDDKKKELKKIEHKFKVGDIIKYVGEREEFSKEKHTIKKILDDCYLTIDDMYIPFKFEEYYILINQNPAWSEEDEKILNEFIESLRYCNGNGYDKQIDWLKSFKDRVQPQPKQEWSEEDKFHIGRIISYLDSFKAYNAPHIEPIKKEIDWLKSIKDKYTWEPAEEQIKALNKTIELSNFGIDQNRRKILESLYNDLKNFES